MVKRKSDKGKTFIKVSNKDAWDVLLAIKEKVEGIDKRISLYEKDCADKCALMDEKNSSLKAQVNWLYTIVGGIIVGLVTAFIKILS